MVMTAIQKGTDVELLFKSMKNLAKAIDLTDEEACIIIYSSIDLDNFTQLRISPTEFNNWFDSQSWVEPISVCEHKS